MMVRAQLAVREALVRSRTRLISLIRSQLRRQGYRVGSGTAKKFVERLEKVELPEDLLSEIAPLLAVMDPLNEQIEHCDTRIAELSGNDEVVARLQTVPGVGPVTAAAFRSTLDEVERFAGAHQVEAYLGLVPREFSSAERQRKGSITKAGNGRLRWLLVEAAWTIQRSVRPETAPLRAWALQIRDRRGKRVAAVALARRLAGILFAMWRDGTDYSAERLRSGRPRRRAAA